MQVFRYDSVESTNETAKRLIQQPGFSGPACVVAREQTAGKGTRGRKWASPKDAGLYLSVMETPHLYLRQGECPPSPMANGDLRSAKETECPNPIAPFEPRAFTLAAGVACVECLQRLFGICLELKPINDLYAQGGKLGGILTEAVLEGGRLVALVTGIGINVLRVERDVADGKVVPISLEELLDPGAMGDLAFHALADALADDVHALNMSVLRGEADRIEWAWQRYRVAKPSLE